MKKLWVYQLDNDYEYRTLFSFNKDLYFFDQDGFCRLTITQRGVIRVHAGYAWDGCTPKVKIGNKVLGIPDGAINAHTGKPSAFYASLIHDMLCQFQDHEEMPFSRAEMDYIFYRILVRDEHSSPKLYYQAVRWLAKPYGIITRWLT